jgi:hypothetical protein
MEEKLLKEKELKELLMNLQKINGTIALHPYEDGSVTLQINAFPKGNHLKCSKSFHNYANDPIKCTLTILYMFFSDPETAEHISSPINVDYNFTSSTI